MKMLSTTGVLLVAMCVVSCGGGGSQEEPIATGSQAQAPLASAAPQATPATTPTGRDVSTLRACEIVKPQDVVTIVGGKLLNEPPGGYPNCAYVLEVKGDTESYRLAFSEPQMYTAVIDMPGFKEKAEQLAGLWDEAYVQPRELGGGFSVVAVRRGDIALEAWGDRREPAIEIAKLAVSRVR